MNRREFMGATAGGLAGTALARGRAEALSRSRPNIIIIMADDLGYGDLGSQGSESINTPNLDRLAEQGVRLTSFFSSSPLCSPSRAGLLTGRYPVRTGLNTVLTTSHFLFATGLGHALHHIPLGLPTREVTMAQALKEAGYATGCIGKWHLGDLKRYRPNHRGFDYYFGLHTSNDHPYLPLYRNDEIVEKHPVDQDYLTRKYTREAIGFIQSNRDRPFFLYLPHTFPHQPLHASPEFRGTSLAGLYGDCVEEIDWSTGEIMKTLDKYGLAENTFVFFTSDNGPWYEGSPGGFRGRKSEIFDGGMRVPAIARWPGRIPAGRVIDQMSMNFDLFATALAMAGARVPDDRPLDGKDILPMLKGEAPSPHHALFFYPAQELYSLEKVRLAAVRAGNWKYHRRHAGWAQPFFEVKRGPMLFNLEDDPDESYNVIARYPEKAGELERLMIEGETLIRQGKALDF